MVILVAVYRSLYKGFTKLGLLRGALLAGLLLLGGCASTPTRPLLEYASFYAETHGEFTAPIDVDAPVLYSWVSEENYIQGGIQKIWDFHKVQAESDDAFNYIEVTLLNHLAGKGWQLEDMEIVTIPGQNSRFRTAYRYLFSRVKQ